MWQNKGTKKCYESLWAPAMISPIMQSAVTSYDPIFPKRVSQRTEEKRREGLAAFWMLKISSFLIEFTMVSFPEVSSQTHTLTLMQTHWEKAREVSTSNWKEPSREKSDSCSLAWGGRKNGRWAGGAGEKGHREEGGREQILPQSRHNALPLPLPQWIPEPVSFWCCKTWTDETKTCVWMADASPLTPYRKSVKLVCWR